MTPLVCTLRLSAQPGGDNDETKEGEWCSDSLFGAFVLRLVNDRELAEMSVEKVGAKTCMKHLAGCDDFLSVRQSRVRKFSCGMR